MQTSASVMIALSLLSLVQAMRQDDVEELEQGPPVGAHSYLYSSNRHSTAGSAVKRMLNAEEEEWKNHRSTWQQELSDMVHNLPATSDGDVNVETCIGREKQLQLPRDRSLALSLNTQNWKFVDTFDLKIKPAMMFGIGDDHAKDLATALGEFDRPECCGQKSKLVYQNDDHFKGFIGECVGAEAHYPCRVWNPFEFLWHGSGCKDGLECKKVDASYVGKCVEAR
eukprot:TRINITY_DN97372_c0_g1_i1.p1 TRINITY_DN97372_c0_g1~~TRINITY_DN97372_c0_g1_i1.p1  ORF type:complete len:225 (+),score=43.08 TRINITY_DN97372_c0_g1_i1:46-720(+)